MQPGDAILLAVVGVLAANHVLVRVPGWERRPVLFWGAQALNLAASIYVMAAGIPGLDGSLRIFNWVFGLLFIVRIVQNNQRYSDARREARRADAQSDSARKERIRAALRAGEADPEGSPD
jgi:hypothetical protein